MRLLPLLAILVFVFNSTFGQTPEDFLVQSDAIYDANPDSSFTLSMLAYELAEQQGDTLRMAHACADLGRYYLVKSDVENASRTLNQALEIYQDFDDKLGQARVYKIKGILLKRIQSNDEAIEASVKSIELYLEGGDLMGALNAEINLSLDYLDTERYPDCKRVLDHLGANIPEDKKGMWYYYHQNYGIYYDQLGQFEKAIESFSEAFKLLDDLDKLDSEMTLLMLMSRPYAAMQDFAKAEALLLESERMAREHDFPHELNEALIEKTNLYVTEGNYVKAYEALEEQTELNQKLYDLEKVSRIGSLEKQLQLSNKERELANKNLELERGKVTTNWLIFIMIFVLVIAGSSLVLYFRTRALKNEILLQKDSIEEKSLIIEDAYESITDSLAYSKRLQDAILPPLKSIQAVFPESFVLYMPKDLVAGDFYWMEEHGDLVFIAAADCTGHGVPGALVSVVCSNALNRCVNEMSLTDPGEILDAAREFVVLRFAKSEREVRDGMDISFCVLNKKTQEVQWAGAYNPLWIVRDDELIEYKGDKMPIGKGLKDNPFTTHKLEVKKGDQLYLFSDGFADQFGGKKGKKFMVGNFKKLLVSIRDKAMPEQQDVLIESFHKWKGDLEQVDDICVIGVRI